MLGCGVGRTLKIFFHDNCFDGASSAALFGELYRQHVDADAEISLQGVQHKRGDPFEGLALDGEDNACVDFRYSNDPKMNWWFDHHVSAFQPSELEAHFAADDSGKKFYDPTSKSCAKFLARIAEEKLGCSYQGEWRNLIDWADIIDGAQFESAEVAVELAEPALKIMTWLEHNPNPELTHRLIRTFGSRSLPEISTESWIKEPLVSLLEAHRANIELIGARTVCERDVAFFDLTRDGVSAHNKFIVYMLFPDVRYTVGLTLSSERAKISVGSNPWSSVPRTHNIATICERFGGGGHPVVGAISLPPDQLERAREIAEIVRTELMEPGDSEPS